MHRADAYFLSKNLMRATLVLFVGSTLWPGGLVTLVLFAVFALTAIGHQVLMRVLWP